MNPIKELLEEYPEEEQNEIIFAILQNEEGANYLSGSPLTDSKTIIYVAEYTTPSNHSGFPLENLAYIFSLLLERRFLIPVYLRAPGTIPSIRDIYYIKADDMEHLSKREAAVITEVDIDEVIGGIFN